MLATQLIALLKSVLATFQACDMSATHFVRLLYGSFRPAYRLVFRCWRVIVLSCHVVTYR